MKPITLTQGLIAWVDDSDYDVVVEVGKRNGGWRPFPDGPRTYVTAGQHRDGNRVFLHNLVNPPPKGYENDHIDHDGLNNCKTNLRFLDRAGQIFNCRPLNGRPIKGIRRRDNGKFQARIKIDDKSISLGTFESEADAIDAYNKKSEELIKLHTYIPNE